MNCWHFDTEASKQKGGNEEKKKKPKKKPKHLSSVRERQRGRKGSSREMLVRKPGLKSELQWVGWEGKKGTSGAESRRKNVRGVGSSWREGIAWKRLISIVWNKTYSSVLDYSRQPQKSNMMYEAKVARRLLKTTSFLHVADGNAHLHTKKRGKNIHKCAGFTCAPHAWEHWFN